MLKSDTNCNKIRSRLLPALSIVLFVNAADSGLWTSVDDAMLSSRGNGAAQAMETAPSSDPLATVLKDMEECVHDFYSRAKVSKTDTKFHFEFKVKTEIDTYTSRPSLKPLTGGILGDLTVVPGEYTGKDKDRLPSTEISGYCTTLTLAPFLKESNSHLLAKLYFPPDTPAEFIDRFKTIVSLYNGGDVKSQVGKSSEKPALHQSRELHSSGETTSSTQQATSPAGGNDATNSSGDQAAKPVQVAAAQPITPIDASRQLGPGRIVQTGIMFHEVVVPSVTGTMKVWVYLPIQARAPLPCVLIAPAGTPLVHGMKLGADDVSAFVPWAEGGFAVVAYELDGPVKNKKNDAEVTKAMREFKKAEAGVGNAHKAMNLCLQKLPDIIDANRFYTAGHSSAGTLALLLASKDPRIKGCVAFAPCTDVVKAYSSAFKLFDSVIPGESAFLRDSSPLVHTAQLKCPTLVYHAQDDSNVPITESVAYVTKLKKTNPRVGFYRARSGDHSLSMGELRYGVDWLKLLAKKSSPN